jgi:hypothetical protein
MRCTRLPRKICDSGVVCSGGQWHRCSHAVHVPGHTETALPDGCVHRNSQSVYRRVHPTAFVQAGLDCFGLCGRRRRVCGRCVDVSCVLWSSPRQRQSLGPRRQQIRSVCFEESTLCVCVRASSGSVFNARVLSVCLYRQSLWSHHDLQRPPQTPRS